MTAAPVVPDVAEAAALYKALSWSERYELRRTAGMGRSRSNPRKALIVWWLARRMARREVFVHTPFVGIVVALLQAWSSPRGSYSGLVWAIFWALVLPFLTQRRYRRAAVGNGSVIGLHEADATAGMPGVMMMMASAAFVLGCVGVSLLIVPVS